MYLGVWRTRTGMVVQSYTVVDPYAWCVEDTERTCLVCVLRTRNRLALVLTLMRAQAEYRLAFAVSGITDVTVVCIDVTVV